LIIDPSTRAASARFFFLAGEDIHNGYIYKCGTQNVLEKKKTFTKNKYKLRGVSIFLVFSTG
jgi:hypothetical protein